MHELNGSLTVHGVISMGWGWLLLFLLRVGCLGSELVMGWSREVLVSGWCRNKLVSYPAAMPCMWSKFAGHVRGCTSDACVVSWLCLRRGWCMGWLCLRRGWCMGGSSLSIATAHLFKKQKPSSSSRVQKCEPSFLSFVPLSHIALLLLFPLA